MYYKIVHEYFSLVLLLFVEILLLFVEIGTYYCYFSQHKGKSQKKWAGPEELWNDKQQQAALEHHKQRSERGIE